ncbi:MAG: hypothetical protein OCD76_01720 [Reichenbachiella sp.]
MQIEEVKRLVEVHEVEKLINAEEALMIEEALPIDVKGEDDSEVLANLTAAIWVLEKMESHVLSFDKAIEEYKQK